jgi:hypothetical protein
MFEFHHIDVSLVRELESARRDKLIHQIENQPKLANTSSRRRSRILDWLGGLLISTGQKLQGQSTLVVQEVHHRKH